MCSLQWYFLSSWACLALELKQQKQGSDFSSPHAFFFLFAYKKIVGFFLNPVNEMAWKLFDKWWKAGAEEGEVGENDLLL